MNKFLIILKAPIRWIGRSLLEYFSNRQYAFDEIPRTGPRAREVDCYSVTLIVDEQRKGLLKEVSEDGVVLRRFSDDPSGNEDISISVEEAVRADKEITHFYGYITIYYSSLVDYLVSKIFFVETRSVISRALKSTVFSFAYMYSDGYYLTPVP